MSDMERLLDAMRSGEWLRTQWIARVAFELGSCRRGRTRMSTVPRATSFRWLAARRRVEQRDDLEQREGDIGGVPVRFAIPRQEWRRTR
jgi:hypothetical protein